MGRHGTPRGGGRGAEVPEPRPIRCGKAGRVEAVALVQAQCFPQVPEVTREVVKGSDYAEPLELVRYELRKLGAQGLDRKAEDARRAELRAEEDRLELLCGAPDARLDVPTGRTYADA